jgi:hypothetical protein
LDVDLTLCDDEHDNKGEGMSVNFIGKVVWAADEQTQSDIYPGMALSIVSMEDDTRDKLEAYLATRGG